jgi:hypothetical protein
VSVRGTQAWRAGKMRWRSSIALSEYLWCHDTRAGYNCDADARIYTICVAGAISAAGCSLLASGCLDQGVQCSGHVQDIHIFSQRGALKEATRWRGAWIGSELLLQAGKAIPQEDGEGRKKDIAGLSVCLKLLIQKPGGLSWFSHSRLYSSVPAITR